MAIGPITAQLSGVVKSVFLPSTTLARLTNIFLAAAVFCKYALYPLSKYVFAKWESLNVALQQEREKLIPEYKSTCHAILNNQQNSIEEFLGELKEKNSIEKLKALREVLQETKNDGLVNATKCYFDSRLKQFLSYKPSLFEEIILTYCSSLCLLEETERQQVLQKITEFFTLHKNLSAKNKHSIYLAIGMLYDTPSEGTPRSQEAASLFDSAYLIVKNSSLNPSLKLELYFDVCAKYPYKDDTCIKRVCKEQNVLLQDNLHKTFSYIDTLDANKQNHFLDNLERQHLDKPKEENPAVVAYWDLQNIKNTKGGADSLSEKIELDKISHSENIPLLEKLHAFYTEHEKDDKANEIQQIIDTITNKQADDNASEKKLKRRQDLAGTSFMFGVWGIARLFQAAVFGSK